MSRRRIGVVPSLSLFEIGHAHRREIRIRSFIFGRFPLEYVISVFTTRQLRGCLLGAVAVLSLLCAAPAVGQAYPSKPIRLIVPFAPAGPVDTLARIVAQHVGPGLGQRIVVDDRPGANGIIGTEIAAKAPADGYTLLLGNVGPIAVNVSLYRHLPYDPLRSFTPIAMIATAPQILVANPTVPARSVQALIRLAKEKPGALVYGSPGKGSGAHLSMELFKTQAGIKILHAPYRGATPALTDLLGGQLSLVMSSIVPAQPYVSAGKLVGLAVTSRERSPALPNVPTMAESGLPGFEAIAWFGLFAPAGVPGNIVKRLHDDVDRTVHLAQVQDQLSRLGSKPGSGTAEDFARFVNSEIGKWGEVVRNAGIKPE